VRFLDVCLHQPGWCERDDHYLDAQPAELGLVLLQLQQVPSAGESTEVAMKDEEQPRAPVVGHVVDPTLVIGQGERRCALFGQVRHWLSQ
jgi:hypothetical protein